MRLPKVFQFDADEVCISKIGDVVMLYPQEKGWEIELDIEIWRHNYLSSIFRQ